MADGENSKIYAKLDDHDHRITQLESTRPYLQDLIDLIKPQRRLSLLQIADKAKPHPSPISQSDLRHSQFLPTLLYKLRNRHFLHLHLSSSLVSIPHRV